MVWKMQLKKVGVLSFVSVVAMTLAWCGKAPNLSFEETLQVYNKQNAIVKDVLQFMGDQEKLIESNLKAQVDVQTDGGKGKVMLDVKSVSDNKTKDSESDIGLNLTMEQKDAQTGDLQKLDAKVNLNTLLKDYQLYFKLNEFALEMNPKEAAGMPLAMVEMFKNKWLTLDLPHVKEMLRASANRNSGIWQNEKLYAVDPSYYTGVVSTTYEWNPAWKVDFNLEEIKKVVLDFYALNETGEVASTGNEVLLAQQQQMKDTLDQIFSSIKFENTEAYFVIRSADKVDFVVVNSDFSMGDLKMKLSQQVKGKVTTAKAIIPSANGSGQVEVTLVAERAGIWSVKLDLVAEKTGKDIQKEQLFKLSWKISATLSQNRFSLQPQFKLTIDKVGVDVDGDFVAKKIANHTFTAPTDAQNLQEIWSALMGGGAMWGFSGEFDDFSEEDVTSGAVSLSGATSLSGIAW